MSFVVLNINPSNSEPNASAALKWSFPVDTAPFFHMLDAKTGFLILVIPMNMLSTWASCCPAGISREKG